jgi:hypothetical protein
MNWQDQLITIYLYDCKHYQNHLWVYSQRMSNYADLRFSDEEVITLYLFGVIDKNRELKKIYGYADRHLRDWFPRLPSYTAYVQRLNKVADAFAPLLEMIQQEQARSNRESVWLMDSFPVALAKQGHRFKACVAKDWQMPATVPPKNYTITAFGFMWLGVVRPGRCQAPTILG